MHIFLGVKSMRALIALTLFALLPLGCSHRNAHNVPLTSMTEEQARVAMQEAARPTREHDLLKQLSGDWKLEIRWWMDPSQPAELSKGSARITPILGGRFIKEEVRSKGKWGPFEGSGLSGFDTINKRFVSTWVDNMITDIMRSEG